MPVRSVRFGAAAAIAALFALASTQAATASDPDVASAGSSPTGKQAREAPPAASAARLSDNVAMYPRAVQLSHSGEANGRVIASATTFTDRGGEAAIFESTDRGGSFQQIASIPLSEHNGQKGLCCGTLYELPQQVGELDAGTLLFAASVGQQAEKRRMSLDIWHSTDHGRTWSYLSACATAPNTGGLWEPEFSIDAQGRLVCHYADETDYVDGTQRLVRTVSTDGVNWGDRTITVQSLPESTRPGMPVVRQRPDGSYLMTYEICGQPAQNGKYDCATYLRTSSDGWSWGNPDDRGTLVTSEAGRYFTHAPTVAITPGGTVLAVGQQLRNADGSIAAGSGSTVFTNSNGGSGPWKEIDAPVTVDDPTNDPCPNYSSALTPLSPVGSGAEGAPMFLEIATRIDADGTCRAYYGTGTIP